MVKYLSLGTSNPFKVSILGMLCLVSQGDDVDDEEEDDDNDDDDEEEEEEDYDDSDEDKMLTITDDHYLVITLCIIYLTSCRPRRY